MAETTAAVKQAHLSDLFHTGEQVDIEVLDPENPGEPVTYPVWMRKPTVGQQEEARAKANAKQHRRKRMFKDKDGDAWVSMWDQNIAVHETKKDLIEAIVVYDEATMRTQAYNDVLFGDMGSEWGDTGEVLISTLESIHQRSEEVLRHNDQLGVEDEELAILLEDDPEMIALQVEYDKFEIENTERFDALMEGARSKVSSEKKPDLQRILAKKIMDMEADMAWYQEYRVRMLFHAVRKIDSHKMPYFSKMEDILELPQGVQSQLMNALDIIDKGGDAKN